MSKKIEEMKSDPVFNYMNEHITWAMGENMDLSQSMLVKLAYQKYGSDLERLKDYAFRINEIYEGRGREMNERPV